MLSCNAMGDSSHSAVRVGRGEPAPVRNVRDWENRQAGWLVLIRRIADRDQAAMAQFYDETSGIVYSLACRMLGNVPDAEEVTVDVYSQIWRTADRYTAERGTVFAWVVNIARSRSLDRLRARRPSEPLPPIVRDDGADPEKLSQLSQQRSRVRAALESLPAEQRTAIELAFFSGMSHSELAAHLSEPLGTIKTRVRSGMLKLRSALGELV